LVVSEDKREVAGSDLERRVLNRVLWPALVIMTGVGLVNVMTLLTEAQRSGAPIDVSTTWILEFSSVSVLVLLVPLVAFFVRVVPLQPRRWYVAVPLYLGMSVVFSGLHVIGMVGLRKLVFWMFWGRSYVFLDAPLDDLLYEYRKDLLPFAVIVAVCHLARRLEEIRQQVMTPRAEALPAGRLTLRSGSRTVWLDAASFEWASAAGNYVEVRASGATHLARMPLSALENLLKGAGVAVIRVHRSRIVNRDRVRQMQATRDGDFVVRLLDGTEVRGSRRYRDILADAD
jgi:hypothetical protein